VGGVTPITVDVRVIASANKDIVKEMNSGNFREDLYYRLGVVHINIPPLRERKDDIDLLIDYFLHKYSAQKKMFVSVESRNILYNYDWPGNIRELENTIHSATVTAINGILVINKLPLKSASPNKEVSLLSIIEKEHSFKKIIYLVEKKIIEDALLLNDNNQTKTAAYLKINRRLLYSKMKELSIGSFNSEKIIK
jgi:two-component system response regulator AtoC